MIALWPVLTGRQGPQERTIVALCVDSTLRMLPTNPEAKAAADTELLQNY